MITTNMREYSYFTYGEPNEYGQATLSSKPVGTIKMSIYPTSQSIQDNINYQDAQYIGLTQEAKVDDTYVIEYEKEKRLKVLYITAGGRYKQVYMVKI